MKILTVQDIENQIRSDMAPLSDKDLVTFARCMGVDIKDMTRAEIESACVVVEQNCYVS